MTKQPRIALISAVAAAIPPATAALADQFSTAEVWNLLDDRLLSDANEQGGLNEGLTTRMSRLIDHAVAEGVDGVLLTCSMYGSVAQSSDLGVPVLAPDEAAFEELSSSGYGTVLVVASFESALHDSVTRLDAFFADKGVATHVRGAVASDALEASKSGDTTRVAASIIDVARQNGTGVDAVFLAQYSLAPAAAEVSGAVGLPVVTGPTSAAMKLRRTILQ